MYITKELDRDEFMTFADSHRDRSFWQTDMMADMQNSKGKAAFMIGVFDENKPEEMKAASLFVLEPAHFGLFHARSPRGPLMDFSADPKEITGILGAFENELKNRGVLYWSMDPYFPYRHHDLDGNPTSAANDAAIAAIEAAGFEHEGFSVGLDSSREPRWMYVVSMEYPDEKALQKSFLRKAQRNIKDAFNSGVTVWEMEEKDLPILDDLLEKTGERKGFSWRGSDYHRQVMHAFHNGGVRFLAASIDLDAYLKGLNKDLAKIQSELKKTEENLQKVESKKMLNKKAELEAQQRNLEKRIAAGSDLIKKDPHPVLAAGIFFTYGNEVLCLMSGFNEDYETFNGLYALHWTMMKYCLEYGLSRYNLYGTSGDFSPNAIDAGVYAFKKGFGGEVIELSGDFHLPVSKSKYRLYKAMKSIKGMLR